MVEKCSFCFHRYQLAKNKAYLEGERRVSEAAYQTACTQACPAGAIVFGDLNNPEHQVHQIVKPDPKNGNKSKNPKAFRLLERTGTTPRSTTCPAGNGYGALVTTTSPMKRPGRYPNRTIKIVFAVSAIA